MMWSSGLWLTWSVCVITVTGQLTPPERKGRLTLVGLPPGEMFAGDPPDGPDPLERGTVRPSRIYSIHVDAEINHNYATTTVRHTILNLNDYPAEVLFAHSFPPQAYISGFSILYNNQTYHSEVVKTNSSETAYLSALGLGQSAVKHKRTRFARNFGHSNYFATSLEVDAHENATFTLKYEQLLKPVLGVYEYQLDLYPYETVESLRVTVDVKNSREIMGVRTPSIQVKKKTKEETENKYAEVHMINKKFTRVRYAPTKWDQHEVSSLGINGRFRVLYKLEDILSVGEMKLKDDYFAYYFNPTFSKSAKKYMILLLDSSHSMSAVSSQMNDAISTVMSTLDAGDRYSVVEFADIIRIFDGEGYHLPLYENINLEKSAILLTLVHGQVSPADHAIRKIMENRGSYPENHRGKTDVNKALAVGLALAHEFVEPMSVAPFIVLISDGKATKSERNFEQIIKNAKSYSPSRVPIFSIALGEDPETDFLRRLSKENRGHSITLPKDADAKKELKAFTHSLQPLTASFSFNFYDCAVHDTVSTRTFFSFFNGSEVVVTGKLVEPKKVDAALYADTANGLRAFPGDAMGPTSEDSEEVSMNNLERIWAFNTIKDALDTSDRLRSSRVQQFQAEKKATKYSLEYNFVTEATDLVVIRPKINSKELDRIRIRPHGKEWSNKGPHKEGGDSEFGFVGPLAIPNLPHIISYDSLLQEDFRKKLNWPVKVGLDGTIFDRKGPIIRLGFGRPNLPYADSCKTTDNIPGSCRYVHFCQDTRFSQNFEDFLDNKCKILDGNVYDGVCCPNPATKVKTTTDKDTTTTDSPPADATPPPHVIPPRPPSRTPHGTPDPLLE